MGIHVIGCPSCNRPHNWFSGSLDQRCLECRNRPPMTAYEQREKEIFIPGFYENAALNGVPQTQQLCSHERIAGLNCEMCSIQSRLDVLENKIDKILNKLKNLSE